MTDDDQTLQYLAKFVVVCFVICLVCYKAVTYIWPPKPEPAEFMIVEARSASALEAKLNALSLEDWELTSVLPRDQGGVQEAILTRKPGRRPATPATSPAFSSKSPESVAH